MSSTDPRRTPVAKDLFTYCTREKIETWHVVRNHNAQGIVDRVICKSCKSEHQFKDPKVAQVSSGTKRVIMRGASGSSKAQVAVQSSKSLEETWFAGIKAWGNKEVGTFSPENTYNKGDVFTHAVFGKGVVQNRRENKIEVLFKDSIKVLPSKA